MKLSDVYGCFSEVGKEVKDLKEHITVFVILEGATALRGDRRISKLSGCSRIFQFLFPVGIRSSVWLFILEDSILITNLQEIAASPPFSGAPRKDLRFLSLRAK